ncbi:MAG: hypothetical protein FJ257_05165 [Phycisphaerae bacterium]|nr:hypothetical protein [Phycisphaerae bacterium]
MRLGSVPVRLALAYVRRLPCGVRPSMDDRLHVLDEAEHRAIRRVERNAVLGGAVIGVFSAALGVLGSMAIEADAEGAIVVEWIDPGRDQLVASLVILVLVTLLELMLIYRLTLRAVHRMALVAGVEPRSLRAAQCETMNSLVEAAMEIPLSRRPLLGIDPLRRGSRWLLWLAALVYKAKVAISIVILRVLLKRLLTRVLVREWLPMIGIPVTAAWDAWLCGKVLRDARLRLFGRSRAADLLARSAEARRADPRIAEAIARAAACAIVEKQRVHDGLASLVLGLEPLATTAEALDDPGRLATLLRGLDPSSAAIVHEAVLAAAVMDGRVSRGMTTCVARALGVPVEEARSRLRVVLRDHVAGRVSIGLPPTIARA